MSEAIKKFDQARRSYLTELASLGMSEQTLKNYSTRLSLFMEFWSKEEPDHDPTPADIREYRDSLQKRNLAKSTVKQYLVELKSFFEFCCDSDFGFYENNPVSSKMYPKIATGDDNIYKKILPTDDFKKLWKNKRPQCISRELWARNYAMVILLLDGKFRNKELLNLKLSDIDFEYKEIMVRCGKGNKRRIVTVSDISISAIKLYLASGVRPDYCTEEDYLFGTNATKRFGSTDFYAEKWHVGTRQWLSEIVERHIEAVTGHKDFRTHSLRHNGAILDINTGVRSERLQAELGHSSVTTTEIYSGRLQSVRRTRDYQGVLEERNSCAAENFETLKTIEPEDGLETA